MSEDEVPQATELIQLPAPSFAPVITAAGVTLALVGAFAGLPYFLVGLVVAVAGLRGWINVSKAEYDLLPRSQEVESAVVPPVPVRRAEPVRRAD